VSVLQIGMCRLAVLPTLACFALGRLSVGTGVGECRREWAACGVPIGERGRLTKAAARQLKTVLVGERVDLGDAVGQRLDRVPPQHVLIFFDGRRPTALARAACLGEGWTKSPPSPRGFAAIAEAQCQQRRRVLGLVDEEIERLRGLGVIDAGGAGREQVADVAH
jgi:hypothetical protein